MASTSHSGPLRRRSTRSRYERLAEPYKNSGLTKYMCDTRLTFEADSMPAEPLQRSGAAHTVHDNGKAVELPHRTDPAFSDDAMTWDAPQWTVATSRRRSKRRVGFDPAVRCTYIDDVGTSRLCGVPSCSGCSGCEVAAPLQLSDRGRHYPEASTRSEQKSLRELSKRPGHEQNLDAQWWDAFGAMCRCGPKGCSVRCPCVRDGIGCWFEACTAEDGSSLDWGCACRGKCASAVPGYICNVDSVKKSRQERLQELKLHMKSQDAVSRGS